MAFSPWWNVLITQRLSFAPQNNFKTVRNNSFLGPFALSLITKGPDDVRLVALGSLSPPLSGGFFDSSTKRSFSVVNVLSAKIDAFPLLH